VSFVAAAPGNGIRENCECRRFVSHDHRVSACHRRPRQRAQSLQLGLVLSNGGCLRGRTVGAVWRHSRPDQGGRQRRGIAKTALGAELTVPWEYQADTQTALSTLGAAGYQIVAVETSPGAMELYE
jgi:hypothetical protein